ncbi:MAG: sulfatase-like hydrolase/transferase [Acidobacteria bacterium]|nr:sulfatase-like hydrolase/transferase [Acidobacteriota bacterium]
MNRRQFLGSLASVAALPAQPKRPNILLILADDLGYECLGCYGGTSYKTPNLDRLAAEGMRFRYAFAQPLCTPTRMQLMTGKYNFRNWQAFGIMDPKERTFGHLFTENGYRTAIAGKWQFWSYNPPDFEPEWRGKGQKIEDAGFDEHCVWHAAHTEDKGSRYGDPTIYTNGKLEPKLKDKYGDDLFADFLLNFIKKPDPKPWFAYWPLALTHDPFVPTPDSPEFNGPNRLKADNRFFKDEVEYMDKVVGRVLSQVPADTLVLFFGDNGTNNTVTSQLNGKPYQGDKGMPTEAGTRVPMIVRWKGVTPAGKINDDLIDSCDFLPTIAAAANVPTKSMGRMDGVSFLPQLQGKIGVPRPWIYSWYDPRPGQGKERWTRTQRYAFDREWKLYDNGRLVNWAQDPKEAKPVQNAEVRTRLQNVLDRMAAVGGRRDITIPSKK